MKTRSRFAIAVLVLVLLAAVVPVTAQERVDLIILLDSSRSMLQYYNQVIDFVVSDAIRQYLRFGDGFHLMNFSDTAQLEVAQVLRTEEDVRTILSRLYLMYPLGRNTDLISALKGVLQYTSGLGSSSSKYIILITDGMHSPSPDSTYALYSADEVRAEMERSATRIRERGWVMRIVQVPFNGAVRSGMDGIETGPSAGVSVVGDREIRTIQSPGESIGEAAISTLPPASNELFETLSDAPGTGDYLADIATVLGTGISTFDPDNADSTIASMVDILQVSYPVQVKTRSRSFKIRLGIKNPSQRIMPVELVGLYLSDGSNILSSKTIAVVAPGQTIQLECSVDLPDSIPEGSTTLVLEPRLANNVRANPPKGSIELDLAVSAFAEIFRRSATLIIFLLILLAALIIMILIFRYIRAVHQRAEEPVLQAFMGSSEDKDEKPTNNQAANRGSDFGKANSGIIDYGANIKADRPVLFSSDHESRNAALQAAAAQSITSSPYEKRNQIILDSAHKHGDANDRAKLLEQWTSGDRARYILPLKTSLTKQTKSKSANTETYVYEPRIAKPGTLRVELRVRNQNPNIGLRNIKTLHAGRHKTIGGKSSDFMVFLLPVPKRIADIHFDGRNITIVPVKPSFFPDYTGPIEAGFGEEIRLVNSRGKELFIRFDRYTPPLVKLNRLLHCIEVSGFTPDLEQEI